MTTAPLKIGLLLCDDVKEEAQAEYGTYSKMFQTGIDSSAENFLLTPIHCYKGDPLPAPADFDGYVISGSSLSVYDDVSWIHDLQEFVRQCWQANVKMVGICFGHQLIAHSLGGLTEKADVGWGFGVHSTKVTKPQPWMDNMGSLNADKYNLIVIHQDQVVKVPPAFKTVAESDFCPNSMIVAGNKMLGIQGHPEFGKEYCEFRATARRELIGESVYESTLHSLDSQEINSDVVLGWVRGLFNSLTPVILESQQKHISRTPFMSTTKLAGHLAALEKLNQADSSETIYDQWANDYDENLVVHYQYIAPGIAVDALCECQLEQKASIIDFGCGTGIVGELLAAKGFKNLDGMDISQGMLNRAEKKRVYRSLMKADLTQAIESADAQYDAMICVGSFANGHLQPRHLNEMLRTVVAEGPVVLFMNEQFYLKDDFPGYFSQLEQQGVWTIHKQERHNYMESMDRPGWLVVATRC